MEKTKTVILACVSVVIVGLVVFLLYLGYAHDLTTNETTLVGILLAFLSVVASGILSSVYAESGHQRHVESVKDQNSLKTFAIELVSWSSKCRTSSRTTESMITRPK